ncbi:MAG: hypothetical protein GX536_09515 [Actinobacteria bacterium]|nr:hypothetical protein [Actinomycetota bacterium]
MPRCVLSPHIPNGRRGYTRVGRRAEVTTADSHSAPPPGRTAPRRRSALPRCIAPPAYCGGFPERPMTSAHYRSAH